MASKDKSINPESVHDRLRAATGAAHEQLDSRFGALDLGERDDYARFLHAHYLGLLPVADAFEAFAGSVLDTGVPDYPAMLRDDLSDLGLSVAGVGAPAAPEGLHPAGVAYVVAGSRLGLASLRRDRFWGKSGGCASRYMTDDAGLNVWRAMAGWMRGARLPASEVSAICDSAVSVFALFEDGLVRSLPEHAG